VNHEDPEPLPDGRSVADAHHTGSRAGNDAAYCHALVGKYQEYVAGMGSGRHGSQDQNASARIAIDKCNAGDPAGIPVLEQELKNAKVTLPQRS